MSRSHAGQSPFAAHAVPTAAATQSWTHDPLWREVSDPRRQAAVEDVELVARWVVEGFMHGLHRSPYVGFSVDFASHREYLPGDDLRHLNWKLYGRHDRLYIKQYDAETNVDLHVVLDVSGSMEVGDDSGGKRRYASLLAASLAHLARRQRDAVGLTIFADRVLDHYAARSNSDHVMALFAALARTRPHPRVDSPRVLHEVAELMPRRGLVVVISDLYYEPDELLASLDHFRHFGHDLLVFQVLSPLERRLPIEGAVKLVDAETGQVVETLAHEIRDRYESAVEKWLEQIHVGCMARDIEHDVLLTDQPLERALFDYSVRRTQWF
ncbi:MAG: DUF58 domain-containing protein [Pirellulales bacterium]